MQKEFDNLSHFGTWTAVYPPKDVKVIGSTWGFRSKQVGERFSIRLDKLSAPVLNLEQLE